MEKKASGLMHRVEDKWGGYFQCETAYGPYNFRGTPVDKKASELKQGDWMNGRKIAWVISNYLGNGKTEVRFGDGTHEYFPMDAIVRVSWSA